MRDIINNSGFGPSNDYGFIAIPKMFDADKALIVSESLEGALRYTLDSGKKYYIYEIYFTDVSGVSLKGNVEGNSEGIREFFNIPSEVKNDNVDLVTYTNGAIHLDEVHVYPENITVDKIKLT